MRTLCCAAAFVLGVPGCAVAGSGPEAAHAGAPARAKIELVDPDAMFRTALTERRLDDIACTYESKDREALRTLRARLFESLAVTSASTGYEPRNKLVFYFDDGKIETLVFSKPYVNRAAVDAQWQGLRAQVGNSFPAELARFAAQAGLPQLNPGASGCDFLKRQ